MIPRVDLRWLTAILCSLAGLLVVSPSIAHEPFEITLAGNVHPDRVELVAVQSLRTSIQAGGLCETTPDSHRCVEALVGAARSRFQSIEARLKSAGHDFFSLSSGGRGVELRKVVVRLTEEEDVEHHFEFAKVGAGQLTIRANLLDRLTESHGVAFNIVQRHPALVLGVGLLRGSQPELALDVVPFDSTSLSAAGPKSDAWSVFPAFFWLGLEHIGTGFDHLLFLGGLLIVCRRLRTMLIIVTCFTLAHSVTLTLAVLGVGLLPSGLVEPLIALSIVYVGVENYFVKTEPKARWLVTLLFGLIHGFGFAGALQEIGLSGTDSSIVVPVLAFNLGVEVGQLLVCAVALPLLFGLKARGWLSPTAIRGTSLLIAGVGAIWLLQRTLLS